MLPEVPTMEEAASLPFEVSSTFGILAPAATPRAVVDRLNRELAKAVQLPAVREALLEHGAFAVSTTPDEAGQRIHSEIAMWARVIQEANLKPD
jgi:tripartite-type tricarboxylate transporter receptor subunit TctC